MINSRGFKGSYEKVDSRCKYYFLNKKAKEPKKIV